MLYNLFVYIVYASPISGCVVGSHPVNIPAHMLIMLR